VCRNFRHTATDGKHYDIVYYNIDVIISVGYRVHSKEGVRFRQWATKVLREHIVKGFTFNKDRLADLENLYRCLNDTVLQTSFLLNKHVMNSARRKDVVILMEDLEKVKKDINDIKNQLSQK
jgi:RNAse (barnase) inhibitor barstar